MKLQKDATPYEKLYTYRFYQENEVDLQHSRPIKRGTRQKTDLPEEGRENLYSARVGEEGGLPKGIQYYRMWFRYLKLALECEEQGIEVVIKPSTFTKRTDTKGLRGGATYHVPRETKFLKVDREYYNEWDCDEVLHQTFDRWWSNHNHLFQASLPEIVTGNTIKTDENHVYLKIDKRWNWGDLLPYLNEELRKEIQQPYRFQVEGKARYVQLVNRYNAVVCCMNGMSAPEVFNDRGGYIRAPEEIATKTDDKGRPTQRIDAGGTLFVNALPSGKLQYSSAFQRLYKGGIFHLLEVCDGRFGAGY